MSQSNTLTRKLAAIMFTDIAGYTEQMSKNEDRAFFLIQKKRDLLLPLIKKYEGKLIKEIGDGTLTRYFKADNAIGCASTFQSKTDSELNVRAGIHTGEVILDKEDVFGDVVNIASRLESIAVPGSILVSKETIDNIESIEEVSLVSLGMQSLKGVGRLIEVYAIKDESLVVPSPDDYTENKINVHSDDAVPSIAIIPFQNKGKEEDVFYAYGISVDLITDVTSAGLIRVASKKHIDDAGDLPQDELAKVLDVRYMANGELWRMGEIFQLSVELYDTKDKKVVWSDRWQEKWDNLPTIKMNLSDGLLKALDTTSKVEKKVETTNTEAYEFYLKAKHKYEKRRTAEDTEVARELLLKAIQIDEDLLIAKNLLGTTYAKIGSFDKAMIIYQKVLNQAERNFDKFNMGVSLLNMGAVYEKKGEYKKAITHIERSLLYGNEVGDKLGEGWCRNSLGVIYIDIGDYENALDSFNLSKTIFEQLGEKLRISMTLNGIGMVNYMKGNYNAALSNYTEAMKIEEEFGNDARISQMINNIAGIYLQKGDYSKMLSYLLKALKIEEKLQNKHGIGLLLNNISGVYLKTFDFENALEYLLSSLKLRKEMGEKSGIASSLNNLGHLFKEKGEYDIALNYFLKGKKIREEIDEKHGIAISFENIAMVYFLKNESEQSSKYFKKAHSLTYNLGLPNSQEINEAMILQLLTLKRSDKISKLNDIRILIKKTKNIDFKLNYYIFLLLNENSYLKKAYKQVREMAEQLKKGIKIKFLKYPIPKAIMEEWKKADNSTSL